MEVFKTATSQLPIAAIFTGMAQKRQHSPLMRCLNAVKVVYVYTRSASPAAAISVLERIHRESPGTNAHQFYRDMQEDKDLRQMFQEQWKQYLRNKAMNE